MTFRGSLPGRLETTLDLVELTQRGDVAARDRLIERYLPLLTRWAHGRLPEEARDLNETADLVQTALMRAFEHLPQFSSDGRGAFFGFLRTIVMNLLRDEIRRTLRRPAFVELPPEAEDAAASPLASAVSLETLQAYEYALQRLDEETRDLVIMRIELGLPHEDIAELTGSASANATRMRIARAVARLAQTMREYRA
jgi:RNA polymerase sigma factor (sigma-70 family)